MRHINFKRQFILIFGVLPFLGFTQVTVSDSVDMGPSYANDIYYSFENGEVASVSRTNWDIAFQTIQFSATILTNGANGQGFDVPFTSLYAYPKADTTGWTSVDTVGLSTWPILFNNEEYWEDGAFNRTGLNHPDYGWGKYNPVNHDVIGDSLFIIILPDGTAKKIWIVRKYSLQNIYHFRYANLDGSDEHDVQLDCNDYTSKNFIYYNLTTNEVVDREPDTASWDILFTKYVAIQPNGDPYGVTGVLDNFNVYANKFQGVEPGFMDWTSQPMDSTRSPIGWDWKTFDFSTGWMIEDSLAFFVHTYHFDIYKLVFTGFTGSASGKCYFDKTLVSPSAVEEVIPEGTEFKVSPNPVRDHVSILFNEDLAGSATVDLYDISGRTVYTAEKKIENGSLELKLPAGLTRTGMHILVVRTGNKAYTAKLMIE